MKRILVNILIGLILSCYPVFTQESTVDMSGASISDNKDADLDAKVKELKNKPLNGFFGFTFSNSVPQEIYMQNIGNAGPGFGVYGGYRFDPIPLTLGMELDFHFFESMMRTYSYKLPNDWTYARDTLHTSSFNFPLTVFARVEPNLFHFVFPYIEGVAGINFMETNATYDSYWGASDDKDEFDVNFLYGIGAGIMIKLADYIQLPKNNTRIMLDLSLRYLWGTDSDYYTVEVNPDASVSFTQHHSRMEQVLFNVGFIFHF